MQQKGVGPITALAFALTIGDVNRFQHSKQVASYLGLIPAEYTSSNKRRLGSHHQARQQLSQDVIGRSSAERNPASIRSFTNITFTCAATNTRQSPRWLRHANWPYGFTGCLRTDQNSQNAVHNREQPAGAPGRRKLDRIH